MRFGRKLIGSAVLAGAFIAASALPAAAMDCVVVHRSTQGALGAANSSQWFTIDINQVLAPCATADQLTQIDNQLTAQGLPLVFDTRTDKVLPSNGHGIVHIDEAYVPVAIGVLGADAAAPCLEH